MYITYYLASILASEPGLKSCLSKLMLNEWLNKFEYYPNVVIVSPARFLSPLRLKNQNSGLQNFLTVSSIIHYLARKHGFSCRTMREKKLRTLITHFPRKPIVFSHHTYNDKIFKIIAEYCDKLYHFKTGDLPHSVIIDKGGFSGWSTFANKNLSTDFKKLPPISDINIFCDNYKSKIQESNYSKYPQAPLEPLNISSKFVFIACQNGNDIVQRLAYIPMAEMVKMVVRRFSDTGYKVLVKPHPYSKDQKFLELLDTLAFKNSHLLITQASIHDILPNASALFTVNSGVGSEALVYELPIYCFGLADYSYAAHQIRCNDDLVKLTAPIRHKLKVEDLRRFIYHYRTSYQLTGVNKIQQRIKDILAN